jgi:hypothetical protein
MNVQLPRVIELLRLPHTCLISSEVAGDLRNFQKPERRLNHWRRGTPVSAQHHVGGRLLKARRDAHEELVGGVCRSRDFFYWAQVVATKW